MKVKFRKITEWEFITESQEDAQMLIDQLEVVAEELKNHHLELAEKIETVTKKTESREEIRVLEDERHISGKKEEEIE